MAERRQVTRLAVPRCFLPHGSLDSPTRLSDDQWQHENQLLKKIDDKLLVKDLGEEQRALVKSTGKNSGAQSSLQGRASRILARISARQGVLFR